ncbi:hypothetical protein QUF70_19425, partial [Desulfobacterales bacterium HSG17]|nr:hypothetical protein [Desulfobacterales bacterium HSG17]
MYGYRIFKNEKIVILRFRDQVTYNDYLNCFLEAGRDLDFSHDFKGLVDERKINADICPEEMKKLADFVASKGLSKGKWAVLVSDPVPTALALIYEEVVSRQHPLGIFSTIKRASEY